MGHGPGAGAVRDWARGKLTEGACTHGTGVWVGLVIAIYSTQNAILLIYMWDAVKLKLASVDLGLLLIIHFNYTFCTLDS